MNETEKVIDSVNKYLSLVRFKYSTEEKLNRLVILDDYYKINNTKYSNEKLTAEKIETAEQLSDKLILPLKVKGIFLSEGRPRRKYYTAEQLKLAAENPLNQKFPIALDHKDTEVVKIVGMVDGIEYDPKIKALRWFGHINSDVQARNILDKAVTQVSATIFASEQYDERLGIVGRDITFKELSLVYAGADPQNSIEIAE